MMRQLSGQDAGFLYLDAPNCDRHGTVVFIYDPSTAPKQPVGFKHILRHVESRLSASSIFRQRLVRVPLDPDFPYWIDDEGFDIEYHLRHMALPGPCDWRQFHTVVSRPNAAPLNLQRPRGWRTRSSNRSQTFNRSRRPHRRRVGRWQSQSHPVSGAPQDHVESLRRQPDQRADADASASIVDASWTLHPRAGRSRMGNKRNSYRIARRPERGKVRIAYLRDCVCLSGR